MEIKGTQRTQIVMDYDDFTRVFEEFAYKVANLVQAAVQAAVQAQAGNDDKELLTAKEVRAMLKVTDKTLFVWNKTGFLPRIRIGGVVRYRRADVERAVQVKCMD